MDNIANVFLAGDYCKTVIDVVTVEGAVVSGLEAAEAVRIKSIEDGKLHPGDRRVRPIDIKRPESYSPLEMLALKAMLAPSAWAAMCMSWLIGQGGQAGLNAADSGRVRGAARNDPSRQIAAMGRVMVAPWIMAADIAQNAWSTWMDMTAHREVDA